MSIDTIYILVTLRCIVKVKLVKIQFKKKIKFIGFHVCCTHDKISIDVSFTTVPKSLQLILMKIGSVLFSGY